VVWCGVVWWYASEFDSSSNQTCGHVTTTQQIGKLE